jgi:predicted Rossmann fold nucleotide-binding protein DprA/Smf involved in DNA uptake
MTATRSDASAAALLLGQRLVETGAQPLKASEYWSVVESVGDPSRLEGLDAGDVATVIGAGKELAERIAMLLGAATSFTLALDEVQDAGFHVMSSLDDEYPGALREHLGWRAPPLLYVAGDAGLLHADLLGIVGSRGVLDAGAAAARQAAGEAVARSHGVVSGGAKGVDRLAMAAALEAGGVAVGVLADSLTRATRDLEVRQAVSDGCLCLCTPFKPTAGFSVANAMGRNKLIYGLSKATLVVAADEERGGTWAGANEALRRGIAPVLVWAGEGAGKGNARLATLGAKAVDSISDLFPLPTIDPPNGSPKQAESQLALDV